MFRRILLATALGIAVVTVPAASAQARACMIGYECYTTYYSDSSHTTVVGGLYEGCDGTRSSWGQRTAYATFVETPC